MMSIINPLVSAGALEPSVTTRVDLMLLWLFQVTADDIVLAWYGTHGHQFALLFDVMYSVCTLISVAFVLDACIGQMLECMNGTSFASCPHCGLDPVGISTHGA